MPSELPQNEQRTGGASAMAGCSGRERQRKADALHSRRRNSRQDPTDRIAVRSTHRHDCTTARVRPPGCAAACVRARARARARRACECDLGGLAFVKVAL